MIKYCMYTSFLTTILCIYSCIFTMNKEIISLNEIRNKVNPAPIQGAVYYEYYIDKYEYGVDERGHHLKKPSTHRTITVWFCKNNFKRFNENTCIELEANLADPQWTPEHEAYCNKKLDPTDPMILPNSLQIMLTWSDPYLKIYHDTVKLRRFEIDWFDDRDTEKLHVSMDVKNPENYLNKHQRPSHLYSNVKEVILTNGLYPEKILTYNAQGNPTIESTWQHKLVQITKWSFIGLILCFVASKCGAERLLHK